MPGYYRSSPDHTPNQPTQRRAGARRSHRRRFGFPSLPVFNPRLLLGPRRPSTTAPRAAASQRLRRWLAERSWNLSHAGAGGMLALGLAGLIYIFTNLNFYVFDAAFAETRYESPAVLYQQAGIDGFSAFFIRPAVVSQRLSQLPTIKSASVRVRLPNRVHIAVVEREPVLLFQVQTQSQWVDAEGVLIPAAEDRGGMVRLIDDSLATQIDPQHLDPAILLAIQQITTDLPQIETFRYQEPFGLYFFSPEGWRVLLGEAQNMDSKLLAWAALRQDLLRKKAVVQEVDLRFHHPIWR